MSQKKWGKIGMAAAKGRFLLKAREAKAPSSYSLHNTTVAGATVCTKLSLVVSAPDSQDWRLAVCYTDHGHHKQVVVYGSHRLHA